MPLHLENVGWVSYRDDEREAVSGEGLGGQSPKQYHNALGNRVLRRR